MKFISTRNASINVSGCEAIVNGLSVEGGLYVPSSFPKMSLEEISALGEMEYFERSAVVINKFVDELDIDLLKQFTAKAYAKFDGEPAPLVELDEDLCILELWHGPTHAFKDIALTLLPYLLTGSKEKLGRKEQTLILVATSGDTGKAALEGFKDVDKTSIIVLYPQDGVSELQKLQMMTQEGKNVFVSAIIGNFDDAQTAVKKIFTDESVKEKLLKQNVCLSSANSINWGRLVPQIAYYFSSYVDLVECGEIQLGDKINFCVPSGNFGNILAGYYAKQMGLPINKLICASNKNNVLTDFIKKGQYDINREFYKTTSPSMDILISSNLERLIFELSGRDDKLTANRMAQLKEKGTYSITESELKFLQDTFYADCASEDEVASTLNDYFEEYGYISDTHTSVALSVYNKYKAQTNDETMTVLLSTASPYKFVKDVLKDIGVNPPSDELSALKKLEETTALPLPDTLACLVNKKLLHTTSTQKDKVEDMLFNCLNDIM